MLTPAMLTPVQFEKETEGLTKGDVIKAIRSIDRRETPIEEHESKTWCFDAKRAAIRGALQKHYPPTWVLSIAVMHLRARTGRPPERLDGHYGGEKQTNQKLRQVFHNDAVVVFHKCHGIR